MPSAPAATGGLISIGAVTINHGDPTFSWSGGPTGHGIRRCTIGGSCTWQQADTLSELVANPDDRTTTAGITGVREYVVFGGVLLASKTGYYLLLDFDQSAEHRHSLRGVTGDVPFTLSAAFLGDLP